jgi:hypothetical protein
MNFSGHGACFGVVTDKISFWRLFGAFDANSTIFSFPLRCIARFFLCKLSWYNRGWRRQGWLNGSPRHAYQGISRRLYELLWWSAASLQLQPGCRYQAGRQHRPPPHRGYICLSPQPVNVEDRWLEFSAYDVSSSCQNSVVADESVTDSYRALQNVSCVMCVPKDPPLHV